MPTPPSLPGGQRYLYWLSEVAQELREEAGVSLNRVADLYGYGERTIRRFEEDADHWPRDLDRLAAAYALALGMPDSRDLFQQALNRWREQVRESPQLPDVVLTPLERVQRSLQPPAPQQSRRARSRGSAATRKKRANG